MCGDVAPVRWADSSEAFPASLTLVAMPLPFSIATGLSLCVVVHLRETRQRQVP